MSTRERRPTVYVLAAIGYQPAGSFQRQLGAALRHIGVDASVRLLRPHTESGIRRGVDRARRAFTRQIGPEYPLAEDFPVTFTTSAESSLNRDASGDSEATFALVVLVSPELSGQYEPSWNLQYAVRCFLRNERPDALIPVLYKGSAPSVRSRYEGLRLLAAVAAEDWRRPGDAAERLARLATRIGAVLATPFPADRRERKYGSQSVVRVDANGDKDCVRVSEGLALARDGGRVEVYPGDYYETPQIWRPVHLVGVGAREKIRVHGLSTECQFPQPRSSAIQHTPISSTIENLTLEPVQSGSMGLPSGSTVWLNAGDLRFRECSITAPREQAAISDFGNIGERELRGTVTFERCIVKAGAQGGQFGSRSRVTFRDCVFVGVGAEDQLGLAQYYGARVRVIRCIFADLGWSVFVQSAGTCEVRDSLIVGGTVGMHIGDKTEAVVIHTRIVGSRWNLQVEGDASLTFYRCRLEEGREGGLALRGRARAVGWDNRISGTPRAAVKMAEEACLLLAASHLHNNGWGVEVLGSASAEVVGCTIVGTENFSAGARDQSALYVRASTLRSQARAIQFENDATGEAAGNVIRRTGILDIGVWSRGTVVVQGNEVGGRIFVAPQATKTVAE